MRANTIMDVMGRLVIQENGCAIWPGAKHTWGYGMTSFEGRQVLVHRLLYEHFVGPVPPGLVLDHFVCDTPACGNFAHVQPVSHRENVLRGKSPLAEHARKTHCVRGHPFSGANLHVDRRGARHCRACIEIRLAAAKSRGRQRVRPPAAPVAPHWTRPRANTILAIMGRLIIQPNGCALWPGNKSTSGYGLVKYQGKAHGVHRLLYEHFVGAVPERMVLDHFACDTRLCGNFAHVRPASIADNARRGNCPSAQNARKTHCCRGHAFNDHGGLLPSGGRYCKQCNREKATARYRVGREALGLPVGPKTGTQTHCPAGHAYEEANSILGPNGWRRCRACTQARDRARYRPRRAHQKAEAQG